MNSDVTNISWGYSCGHLGYQEDFMGISWENNGNGMAQWGYHGGITDTYIYIHIYVYIYMYKAKYIKKWVCLDRDHPEFLGPDMSL